MVTGSEWLCPRLAQWCNVHGLSTWLQAAINNRMFSYAVVREALWRQTTEKILHEESWCVQVCSHMFFVFVLNQYKLNKAYPTFHRSCPNWSEFTQAKEWVCLQFKQGIPCGRCLSFYFFFLELKWMNIARTWHVSITTIFICLSAEMSQSRKIWYDCRIDAWMICICVVKKM